MQPIKYDPTVIHSFARQLYRRAATIVATYVLVAAAVAVIAGTAAGAVGDKGSSGGLGLGELIALGTVGGLVGYLLGSQRAFALRLQAQTALCQAQIEANPRNLAYVMAPPLSPPDHAMAASAPFAQASAPAAHAHQ